MARITLLTPDQLAERAQKPKGPGRTGRRRSPERTSIIEEYKAVLREAEPGYGGDVSLSEGEEKRIVRLNLKAAAEEVGKALDFRPIKNKSRIHFRVITLEEKAAKPKRGGRPRKQRPEELALTASENDQPTEQAQAEDLPAPKRRGSKPAAPVS